MGALRQPLTHRVDPRLHELERPIHVGAPRAIKIDLGRAATRGRAHLEQAGHALQRLLERARDGAQHLLARALAAVGDHLDAGERHFGQDRRGQPGGEPAADSRGADDERENGATLGVEEAE